MSFHNIEAQWGTTEGSTKVEFKFQRNPMTDEGTGVSLPDCHDYNKTTVTDAPYWYFVRQLTTSGWNDFTFSKEYPRVQGKRFHPGKQRIF